MPEFSSDNQPSERKGRGKSEKTKYIEALKRINKTEDDFYDAMMLRAFDPDDSIAFKEALNRMSPVKKAVAPCIEFDFPEDAKPHVQASAVMKGIAEGLIPPDIGAQFVGSISNMLKIQEITDIEERLKVMESQIESPE